MADSMRGFFDPPREWVKVIAVTTYDVVVKPVCDGFKRGWELGSHQPSSISACRHGFAAGVGCPRCERDEI